jgi:ASCH domain
LRALLIRHPWIDMILTRTKVWEIRGSRTSFRETIALIASRSGTVIGVCDLVDCVGPLTAEQFRKNAKKAGMHPRDAKLGSYRQTYAWVLEKPRMLKWPVPYRHPSGAVIWVRLDGRIEREIGRQLPARRI